MKSPGEHADAFGDRFVIEELVASGGMGTVYRARDKVSGEPVALKLLSAGPEHDNGFERFAREARILSDLHHPGIVAYIAHGRSSDGQLFLAMQWLEGEDLAGRLKRGPLTLGDSLILMKRVAAALSIAHERRIVHRDLKPSNLFLRQGSVELATVLDFGIAHDAAVTGTLTKTGAIFGTPSYLAPERARGQKEVNPASDIFSLGGIFYECLAGKRPFEADHVAAVLARILFDEPAPLSRARANVPEAWARLIQQMLEKDPGRRPPDAAALFEELSALPDATEELNAPSRASSMPPQPQWSRVEQTLASVVLAVPREPIDSDAATLDIGEVGALERMRRSLDTIRSTLIRVGSHIEALADGSILACVVVKGSAKDQAIVAARTALALREQWRDARIAVATGRSILDRHVPVGEAVDRATRLLDQASTTRAGGAPPEGILLDEMTAGLLHSRFSLAPFEGGAILLDERASSDDARLLLGKPTPCVGRDQELSQLESIMARCAEEGIAQAALITAPPGAGKSRVRHEFLRRQSAKEAPPRVLIGFGDPLSAGSPYGLVSQALRRYARLDELDHPAEQRDRLKARFCARINAPDTERIAEFIGELCGIPFPSSASAALTAARSDSKLMREQIEQAFLDWLGAEGAASPMIFVLEDLQWGDKLTANLIDAALRDLSELPLFILALARPEVSDLFPALWSGRVQEMPLRPLSRRASERLVREVLGEQAPSPEDAARIVERAGGNALFLEELIRAAAEGKEDTVPGTVLAMLQARLSRLPSEARTVLGAASIFGETFWVRGVRALCEPSVTFDVMDQLDYLVACELLEKHRRSRFPRETELGFRHALVRDAAYSLLADANRALGHRLACHCLEEMGEADAMALAEHAQLGGDNPRAIAFFIRAADQSFEQNDLEGALARAQRGIAAGAEGEPLGVLRAIQCLASFGVANWTQAAALGLDAIKDLPRGGLWWCRVVEKLFHTLPTTSQPELFHQIVRTFTETEPDPRARSEHACAAAYLVGMFGLVGARDELTHWLSRLDAIRAAIPEHDAYTHGTITVCEAWAKRTTSPDIYLTLRLGQESVKAFELARHSIKLCVAVLVTGVAQADLADLSGAVETLRRGMLIAKEARDPYSILNSQTYLAATLLDCPGPTDLDEAELLGTTVLDTNFSAAYNGIARWILAAAHLQRGRAPQAEAEARRALELLTIFPPYMPAAHGILAGALRQMGRSVEAAAVAREGLDLLARLGGTGFSEVPFRVAAAEAFEAAGELDEGRRALRAALDQIAIRADKIPEPRMKERYLTGRPENIRARELARDWFGHT